MSATDELRRLLDERGVEWDDRGYPKTATVWKSDGIEWFGLWRDGAIELEATMTPEQAVEATLGRGECRDAAGKQMAFFSCSACGATIERKHPRFCFACGRKVVDE